MTEPTAEAIRWQLDRMDPIDGRQPTVEDALRVLAEAEQED